MKRFWGIALAMALLVSLGAVLVFSDANLDRKASKTVFEITDKDTLPGARTIVALDGLWQAARWDDPDMDKDTYAPMKEVPKDLVWKGINVPGDLKKEPDFDMAHRVWYRTKVKVDEAMAGKSFILDFSGTNWIASVVVNGQFIAAHKSTRIPWQCDITRAIRFGKKPDQINEICIGIKDPWYAIDAAYKGLKLNDYRKLAVDKFRETRFVAPIYPSTKGDADGTQCGITDQVRMVATAGSVYVTDAFVKTTVTDENNEPNNKKITAEITVLNPTDKNQSVVIKSEAMFVQSSAIEKELDPVTVTVPAGGTQTVTMSGPFPNAQLWWPQEDPAAIYALRTFVKVNGQVTDLHEQLFGFREVKIDGPYIRINGLRRNFWNLLDGISGDTPEGALVHFYEGNNRFERFGADLGLDRRFGLKTRKDQLIWADQHGIPGRLSTMIDGMFINYDLTKEVVWQNFAEHIGQVVKAYRNHPSVIVYSLENELLFINGALGYSNKMEQIEANAKKYMLDVSHKLDPTRPAMFDGGGAFKDNSGEICCTHYAEDGFYPDNAYPMDKIRSMGRWTWDKKRPYAAGEVAYFSGNNADHAWIGGEAAAESKLGASKAYSKYIRYLFERYRWNDVAMICPWTGQHAASPELINAMSPIAAFTREYNANFFSGAQVTRTVKVFNDTFSKEPLTFTWAVEAGKKRIAGASQTLSIEPGFGKELTVTFTVPAVKERTSARLVLEVAQKGAKSYKDVKEIAFFPKVKKIALKNPVFLMGGTDELAKSLANMGVNATAIESVEDVKTPTGIIIVGADSVKNTTPLDELVEYASAGGRIIILEQKIPITGKKLSVKLNAAKDDNSRGYSVDFNFGQGFDAPLLKGLAEADLSLWAGDYPMTYNVWEKPGGVTRSWVNCGSGLKGSTLIEIPYDKGNLIATQLRIAGKLAVEPAAQILMANMLLRCDTYQPATASVGIYAPDREEMVAFMNNLDCDLVELEKLEKGLNIKTTPILIVSASKQGLRALSANKGAADKYVKAGGWIILWGLEPDGLDLYNNLLSTKHILREFRVEAVKPIRDKLMVGVDSSDVYMFTNEVIAPWSGLRRVSGDVFTYCVDGADIAPFCYGPANPKFEFKRETSYQLVDGLFNADFWWYINQIAYKEIPPEFNLMTFKMPAPSVLQSITIWNNANYDTVKDCDIRIDGKSFATVELPDSFDAVEVKLNNKAVKDTLSLVALSIRVKQDRIKMIGLDEVSIIRELPAWYQGKVFPLVNCGGIVRYPRGKGGFILNNLKLVDKEIKENVTKKQRIVSVILQNLGAAFQN
ncbi:MAG: glycoside hydrolase family 2 TIM barrel-domain containing protein [Bacillota bacterium]